MATFAYDISPYRKGDGTRLVKVRMTHRRRTIRKPLGIYASDPQLSRDKTKIRDLSLLNAVNRAVEAIRQSAAEIPGAEWMDADDLWRGIEARMESRNGFSLDFFAFSGTVTAKMEKGTADGYKYALKAFASFLGKDCIDVNEIDKATVLAFREWIEKRNGKGCRASSAYLEKLRMIHNRAREKYNDDDVGMVRIPRQPFRGLIPPQPATRHRVLTLDQLRRIADCNPATARGRLGKDVFLLSFCLIGMNTADIYGIGKDSVKGGVLTYSRGKTDSRRTDRAVMSVRVEPEAVAILSRWSWPPPFRTMYADFRGFNSAVNEGLKEVARLCGIPELTSYYARHTWATLARNSCGILKDVVHEALNHASRGDERVTDIYLARDWSRTWEANRKVLDLVFGAETDKK